MAMESKSVVSRGCWEQGLSIKEREENLQGAGIVLKLDCGGGCIVVKMYDKSITKSCFLREKEKEKEWGGGRRKALGIVEKNF